MRDRLTLVFGALVLLPVIVLALLGTKIARDEGTMVRERLEALREDRLVGLAADVRRTVERVETELAAALDAQPTDDPDALRDLVREMPLVTQVFVLDARGELRFPVEAPPAGGSASGLGSPPSGLGSLPAGLGGPGDAAPGLGGVVAETAGTTEAEKAFLGRTQAIWRGRAILYEPPIAETTPRVAETRSGSSLAGQSRRRAQGWVTWYWAEGLHLLFWRALPSGEVIGVEVDRVGLLARVIGALPALEVEDGRVALTDGRGDTVFQWGGAEPREGERPAVRRALDYPLESFGLADYPEPESPLGDGSLLGVYASIVAVIGLMMVLAVYFHRERTREMREARQRVGFVTQVSHELKTPLTNIRLYAELLGEAIDEEEQSPLRRHLDVIVSESQRLSRLIHNILTFSKHTHDHLELRRREVEVEAVVAGVVDQFAPAFAGKGLVARVIGAAPAPVSADPDALGQVLGNLLSNVEKYAPDSRWVDVELSQDADRTTIAVRDHGRGIPTAHRERVFEAFVRLGDRLSDGAGTGIGLTIARQLVRLHGGELTVEDAGPGARFVITLPRQSEPSGAAGDPQRPPGGAR